MQNFSGLHDKLETISGVSISKNSLSVVIKKVSASPSLYRRAAAINGARMLTPSIKGRKKSEICLAILDLFAPELDSGFFNN